MQKFVWFSILLVDSNLLPGLNINLSLIGKHSYFGTYLNVKKDRLVRRKLFIILYSLQTFWKLPIKRDINNLLKTPFNESEYYKAENGVE